MAKFIGINIKLQLKLNFVFEGIFPTSSSRHSLHKPTQSVLVFREVLDLGHIGGGSIAIVTVGYDPQPDNNNNENYDIARAMSSSRADPVLGHCPGWGYLNNYISVTALAEGI